MCLVPSLDSGFFLLYSSLLLYPCLTLVSHTSNPLPVSFISPGQFQCLSQLDQHSTTNNTPYIFIFENICQLDFNNPTILDKNTHTHTHIYVFEKKPWLQSIYEITLNKFVIKYSYANSFSMLLSLQAQDKWFLRSKVEFLNL